MKKFHLFLILLIFCITLEAAQDVTLVFAGDTMLGRLVNEAILLKGYLYPWGNLIPLLQSADLRIINLETTLTLSANKVPKVFNFKSDPKNVKALQEAHIDVVNLANNHIKDFGNEGLIETLHTLHKAGIQSVGAGKNIQDARAPLILQKNGIKIGIIGATDNEPSWIAHHDAPGTNYFDVTRLNNLLADIKNLKKRVDIIIVSLQWGPNMRERPTKSYINAAHKIIDAGADILHGHSAHNFQGIEKYNDKLILYDTGDFVDDYRVDPKLRNDWSFLYFVTVSKDGLKKVKLIPLIIKNMQVNTAQGAVKSLIMKRMQSLSQEFKTPISSQGIITF